MVALDDDQSGEGWLFWDDGESLRTYEDGKYSLLHFVVQNVRCANTIRTPFTMHKCPVMVVSMAMTS